MTDRSVLNDDAVSAARRLLGAELTRELPGGTARLRIVETEAYDQTDAASHSYSGRTPRTDVMFGPARHLYVYFTYGMHYCMNVVVGPEGYGAAVLIRAVEPVTRSDEIILQQQRLKNGVELTNGPAKLCQALAVDRIMNGHDLAQAPLQLVMSDAIPDETVITTTRVGISKARDEPWRFYIRGNPYVSRV
ncbi:MAG TPA: DNA-3-methyladenine glycosylase [Candidatus Saccharimonadales bacterium]